MLVFWLLFGILIGIMVFLLISVALNVKEVFFILILILILSDSSGIVGITTVILPLLTMHMLYDI